MDNMPVNVMIIDDSAVVRQVLSGVLSNDSSIRVIGVASDPLFALERMKSQWPDVIVLDIEMPRMDGITFLKKLMFEHPTPVVICSTLTAKGAEITLQAMAAGAVSIVPKPTAGLRQYLQESAEELVGIIKGAAQARVKKIVTPEPERPQPKLTADAILPAATRAQQKTTERVIAIGTSTGGTQALEAVLSALPPSCPGLVIVQHMPEKFTEAFASRLNSICKISVQEARDGDAVEPGKALIAPGGKHMLLKRNGTRYYVEIINGPHVCRHRPSVDVLFRSAARSAGKNALGVIMTGMGDDGAHGLKEMHDVGAKTIAQDEDSCVVYGMPREAIRLGSVDHVVSLREIPGAILRLATAG